MTVWRPNFRTSAQIGFDPRQFGLDNKLTGWWTKQRPTRRRISTYLKLGQADGRV